MNFSIFKLISKPGLYFVSEYSSRLIQNASRTMATKISIPISQINKNSFQDVLPQVIDDLTKTSRFAEVPEIAKWVPKVLTYNLEGGKKARGLITAYAYEMLEKPENITEESLRRARIMGWCVEMLQAYLVILDDIMDGSTTRRGKDCWYKLPEIGLGAINDSLLIYTGIFQILKSEFSNTPIYSELQEIFNETLLYTSMGQYLDYTMAHRKKSDYSLFTIERFESIVKYKTAYYTYKLPVSLGLLLANNKNKETHKIAEQFCLEIGKFFQMQDDFIDCYGDESVTGKAGTDIQEGKCSWLAVNALRLCNEKQKTVFSACYASDEPAHIERIKELYKQLNLQELYRKEENERYHDIVKRAKSIPKETGLRPELFITIIDMIYKRKQ